VQIPIEDIIVKKRIRKDLGDINALADSLRQYGLINPVLINKRNVLIAGRRRLEAARKLGWRTINATIVDAQDSLTKLEYELEENFQRSDFSGEETQLAMNKIRKLRNPGFFTRIWLAIKAFFARLFKRQD